MYLIWLRAATVLYGIASLAAIPAVRGGQSNWKRFCATAAMAAWLLQLVGMIEMLTAHHHWIPTGAHEAQTALALLVTGVFLIVWFVYRTLSFAIFALPLSRRSVTPSAPTIFAPDGSSLTYFCFWPPMWHSSSVSSPAICTR